MPRFAQLLLRGNENIKYFLRASANLNHNHRVYGHLLYHRAKTVSNEINDIAKKIFLL